MGAGKEKNCRLGTVGGQAVMEGVMMKSREGVAIAVRRMDDKRIVVRKKDYKPLKEKCAFFRIPVIRGIVNFVDMMRLSLSTMTASADMLGLEEEGEPSKFEKWLDKHFGKSIMAVASALGIEATSSGKRIRPSRSWGWSSISRATSAGGAIWSRAGPKC